MGDISEDWEVVEERSSYPEESKSNAKWILDKGLNIGKKIVITGVVISSAPFILPPLVVVSALGFAFSVPSVILWSSYACTQKLMSKLLPIRDEYWENEGRDLEEERGDVSAIGYAYEGDPGKYPDSTEGIEEEPLTKSGNTEQPPSDHDHVTATEEDVETENYSLGAGKKFPTPEQAQDIEEAGKEDDKVEADTMEAAQEADTKEGDVAGKGDEKDAGVTEKTIINGNEPNKKTARKKKGNKKQDAAGAGQEEIPQKKEEEITIHSAEEEKDIPSKAPEDTAEPRSSGEVPESKQAATIPTGGRTRRRKDMGKDRGIASDSGI